MPSAAIARFSYDPDRRELLVRFQSGGEYLYFDVPPEVYQGFRERQSKGRYFQDRILGRYAFERLDGPLGPRRREPEAGGHPAAD